MRGILDLSKIAKTDDRGLVISSSGWMKLAVMPPASSEDGGPDSSVVHRHSQTIGETGANRDVDFEHMAYDKEETGRSSSGSADSNAVARLRLAKALSFSSGAGMVAWNKFSSLWLLSVGFTPTGLCHLVHPRMYTFAGEAEMCV